MRRCLCVRMPGYTLIKSKYLGKRSRKLVQMLASWEGNVMRDMGIKGKSFPSPQVYYEKLPDIQKSGKNNAMNSHILTTESTTVNHLSYLLYLYINVPELSD